MSECYFIFFIFLRGTKMRYSTRWAWLWHYAQMPISEFTVVSISWQVYVQSLCYQNSFILKSEPYTITKIWLWDSLRKRDIKETFG